ncbi:hypothetical protein KSF_027390 [Reticulibacter mediterranei]|uniref:Uncharacterized protein n=1 Tax=Reticulibacter mediterranei TaxID=2778369 RepID=A0A8J3INQ6_9CHLR|nr:hypothetical protein [Reticulibacter mediterranei]GHO92691.1 hypothetical protein KSF_027390 [Reticulibacter mediterranei]
MFKSNGVPLVDPSRRWRHGLSLALGGIFLAVMLVSMLIDTPTRVHAHPATVNMNCTLIVPRNPLSAAGLATPYILKATNPADGPCLQANPMQSAFVQAAVVNPKTGFLAVYDPLVIDQRTRPAARPVIPFIPTGSVVGIWFGFNGAVLTLQGEQANTLAQSNCVNGIPGSPFGQFAYCNAVRFFAAAHQGIKVGNIVPPALGRDRKGLICPTTRSFFIVDQDQSDNVTTSYLIAPNGRLAQNTVANRVALRNATVLTNPSDNRLLISVDATLGCTPWMRPDLADPGHLTTALPLNELQAAVRQPAPVALIPFNDPMVLVMKNNTFVPNLTKLNLFRVGVDQPVAQTLGDASPRPYCINLMQVAPPRLAINAPLLGRGATPDAAVGNTLFTFMAQRYVNTFVNPLGEGLNCMKMFHLQPLVATVKTGDDVAIAVLITVNGRQRCFNSLGIVSPIKACAGATSTPSSGVTR